MALPFLLALMAQQEPIVTPVPVTGQEPAVVSPAPPSFAVPPAIAEGSRLALTPKLDGKIDAEEWDPFTSSGTDATYFQWEPGALYVGAKVAADQDLIVSIDLGANGWLIGNDNLEVRVTNQGGTPTLKARMVDATNPAGPTWRDLPGFSVSSTVTASTDSTGTTYEIALVDPGLGLLADDADKKLGVRIDSAPPTFSTAEAYLPRLLAPVKLVYYRSAGLPAGLKYAPEGASRSVVAGQTVKLRLTFEGGKKETAFSRLDLRSEGLAKDATNTLGTPFPPFDNKGRTFVDYETAVAAGAVEGYRVLRANVVSSDDIPALLQTSYRIAPPADVWLVHDPLPMSDTDRSLKRTFYISSNSSRVVSGKVKFDVPLPLKVLNGNERTFAVSRRGKSRQIFELYIPAGYSGTVPVTFSIATMGETREQKGYLSIGQ